MTEQDDVLLLQDDLDIDLSLKQINLNHHKLVLQGRQEICYSIHKIVVHRRQ
jgi:hypothetical protein